MKKLFFLFILLANVGFCFQKVYIFTSQSCPHCRDEKAFIEKIKHKYLDVKFVYIDIVSNRENQKLYHEVLTELNVLRSGLPTTVIGNRYFVGFSTDDTSGQQIEEAIIYARKSHPDDIVEKVMQKKSSKTQKI